MQKKLRIGVLGSGNGGNFQAISDAAGRGELDVEVACVVSDVADAGILGRARAGGVPAYHVDGAPFKTKLEGAAEEEVVRILRSQGAEAVVLAGYLRIVKPRLLGAFPHRILNTHPALLPCFPGLDAWGQALAYGVKVTGCTVHFVDEGTDTGPIILQRTVPVLDGDTRETLLERIQGAERPAYVEAVGLLAAGRLRIVGRRVFIGG